jgi:hypothetical protein
MKNTYWKSNLLRHLAGMAVVILLGGCDNETTPNSPNPEPCVNAEDCGENRICTPSGCAADGSCEEDGDCTSREVCADRICLTRPPCTDDSSCSDGSFCSASGECLDEGGCAQNEDCQEQTYCSVLAECIEEGTCLNRNDCEMGMVCTPENQCVPGSDCGAEEFAISNVSPNLLMVLDRSCSMKNNTDGVRKWDAAVAAIRLITSRFATEVRWGLSLFPDTVEPKCEQSTISVPVAADGAASITTFLTDAEDREHEMYPSGPCVTNIDSAMKQAGTDPALADIDRANHVLLITDGSQSGCSVDGGNNGTKEHITALFDAGVTTHIIGFGGSVNRGKLNEFAVLGGAPLEGERQFHQADAPAELEASLQSIIGDIIGCTYSLDSAPTDLEQVHVFFDDVESIDRDESHTNGWDYDAAGQSVTFYGVACERLKQGKISDVDIVFGCAGPVIL